MSALFPRGIAIEVGKHGKFCNPVSARCPRTSARNNKGLAHLRIKFGAGSQPKIGLRSPLATYCRNVQFFACNELKALAITAPSRTERRADGTGNQQPARLARFTRESGGPRGARSVQLSYDDGYQDEADISSI